MGEKDLKQGYWGAGPRVAQVGIYTNTHDTIGVFYDNDECLEWRHEAGTAEGGEHRKSTYPERNVYTVKHKYNSELLYEAQNTLQEFQNSGTPRHIHASATHFGIDVFVLIVKVVLSVVSGLGMMSPR